MQFSQELRSASKFGRGGLTWLFLVDSADLFAQDIGEIDRIDPVLLVLLSAKLVMTFGSDWST